jgi:hypothetical protein
VQKINKLDEGTFTNFYVVQTYIYNREDYPSYLSGSGYLIPWWSLACLYQEGLKLHYFFIKAIFISGFLADRCLIHKKPMEGFSPGKKEASEVKPDIDIMIPNVDHDLKYDAHKAITMVYQSIKYPKSYVEYRNL